MRLKRAIFLGVSASILAIIAITSISPPIDDFEVNNPFWNGLSELNLKYKPTLLSDISKLQTITSTPQETMLLIIGPSKPFTDPEAQSLKAFLNSGGLILLADDYGSGNTLLEKLGVKPRFSNLILQDPLFREKVSILPKILSFSESKYTEGVNALVFNYGTTIIGVEEGIRVLAYSTSFSYIKSDVEPPDEDSPVGPFPVLVEVPYGKGALILLSDSSLFINGMLKMEDNEQLLENLAEGRRVLLDNAHWTVSPFTNFKIALMQIYSVASIVEVKYCIAALAVVLSLKVSLERESPPLKDEVEKIIREHPDWDLETLKKLAKWRSKHGEG